ncbi:hypothetical protein PsYK624_154930 [Phanerochaete sordida]|uniref:DUF6533 domain-containing protein n=1 Tax=Phanerochaete sordida TaxID=48140 RepID=A0A9P3GNY7_9APHY|nr:hypothetical protein PsYK624_154930 [Phanerochaete sordida]
MSASTADFLLELSNFLTDSDILSAVTCLTVYEFIITFDQEVAVVWSRKLTATSILLLALRWLMVLGPLLQTIPFKGQQMCILSEVLNGFITCATATVISLVLALRVYALWKESRLRYMLAGLVFVLLQAEVWTNVFGYTRSVTTYDDLPIVGHFCVRYLKISPKVNTSSMV